MENSMNGDESALRLQRLTDVIFALSMVLFIISGILQFSMEKIDSAYHLNPLDFVLDQIYELFISFLVFLFMALYWFTNIRLFRYIQKVDILFIWIQILFLFFVAIAPLPNALSIRYSDDLYVQMFFNITMFFIGFLAYLSWYYASKNQRLVSGEITLRQIRKINREMAVEPMVALLAVIASLIDTSLWTPVLCLMPVLIILNGFTGRRKSNSEEHAGISAS